jgi:hypothetical protein
MELKDTLGHSLSGASQEAVEHYETALAQLRCYIGDPVAASGRSRTRCPSRASASAPRPGCR